MRGDNRVIMALIGDEEEFPAALGLEIDWSLLAAQVVTDAEGVALELVDGRERLPRVGALDARDIHGLGSLIGIELHGPRVGLVADGHGVSCVLQDQLHGLEDRLRVFPTAELARARQPGALDFGRVGCKGGRV